MDRRNSLSSSAPALSSVQDGIMTLTLNRPEKRNAVNGEMAALVSAMLDEFAQREELRVCVLTGAGNTFCAGMDLKAFLGGGSARVQDLGFLGLTERRLDKPLIAAVEGYALGGGFEAVLACDLVVAANDASFGLPEVKHGLAATGGGLVQLPRRIPMNCAMEIALTGTSIGAERACHLGLVNRLAPPGKALEAAWALAGMIAANAPLAVAASKAIIRDQADWQLSEFAARQAYQANSLKASRDAHEGARAFIEKRVPVFTGT